MKNLLIAVGSILCFFSCVEKKELTSVQILEKTIDYHDPKGEWNQANVELSLLSQSVFSEQNKELIHLGIDVPNDSFSYSNTFRNEQVSYAGVECVSESKQGLCAEKQWTKNFYTYIWGLPMKLKDKGTELNSNVIDTVFFEIPCYALNVKYEAENWLYFVNKKSFQLEGFQFIFNKDATKGEVVRNLGTTKLSTINIPSERIWYDLKGKELGTDIVQP